MEKLRAAAYARYSTDNQTENSIAYQIEKIQTYCKENDIQLVSSFIDEGQTGTNTDRKGFINMLTAAQNNKFEAVVIYDITRGSRDVADWFNFRKVMAACNVQVISCTQKLGDIYNSNDFLVELISVGLGQREVLETRQKSIDGVAIKAKQGQFLGGVAPFGYTIVNGQYIIDKTEAKMVQKIFSMYASGCGYSEIISSLGNFTGRYGRPFGKNSLSSILRNERYIGVYFWNKRKVKQFRHWAGGAQNPDMVRIENSIPAIIDKDMWEAVQMRLRNNKRNACNKAKREYILSGLIECATCGSAYVGRASRRKDKNGKVYETIYYACGNKYRTKKCSSKNIRADILESFVIAHVKDYIKNADFKKLAKYIADKVNENVSNVENEKSELLKIDAKIKNGVNAILSGADIPELSAEIENLRLRKAELTDIINAAKLATKKVDPTAIENLFISAASNIDNSDNQKALIKAFVTKIYANPDGSATVQIGIHMSDSGNIQGFTTLEDKKNKTDLFGLMGNSGRGI